MPYRIQMNNFEDRILAYEKLPLHRGKFMLYGSSFFANWGYDRAYEQLRAASGGEIFCVNHGFGGASVDELLYYYPRMVKPYAPKAIVLRCGLNDIFQGLTPDVAFRETALLAEWLRTDFPGIKIGLVNAFECPRTSSDEFRDKMSEYNHLIEKYAENEEGIYYLDINEFFYESTRYIGTYSNFRPIFIEDGLHLTDNGYMELSGYLAEKFKILL